MAKGVRRAVNSCVIKAERREVTCWGADVTKTAFGEDSLHREYPTKVRQVIKISGYIGW
ncbi:hypothetical protein FOIG_04358 [Fusarium odoratissimum NRRL 54006]|uniref:Uncharacterized protein n=2 Tax=Fusarium oxysporum species complex TaxID=171631 RepID=X0JX96_FUSO5|nr:uncharacterized protein FOIG_04358 [Fusarium odoratissimum NRRL 54006]EXM05909.1 hypothetical protein FOIG_04358 [Fusarium odoratissimum NRRL 54006]